MTGFVDLDIKSEGSFSSCTSTPHISDLHLTHSDSKLMSKLSAISMLESPEDSDSSSPNLSYFEIDELHKYSSMPSKFNKRYQLFKKFTIAFFISSFFLLLSLTYIICTLINPFFLQDFLTRRFDSHNTLRLLNHQHDPLHGFITNVEHLNKDREILPIHSHNDYLRKYPLFDALKLGIDSVEADVWSIPNRPPPPGHEDEYVDDMSLYVGHHKMFLSSYKTLENMYLDPIEDILDHVNSKNVANRDNERQYGVFYNDPSKTLHLIVDIKNDPNHVFKKLQHSLRPFIKKNYLTTFDTTTKTWSYGPLTIIISGITPYDQIKSQVVRNCFVDAPLKELLEDDTEIFQSRYTPDISIFGSDSLLSITGSNKALANNEGLSQEQLDKLKKVIDKSHEYGIKARVWETPGWPIVQRNKVWSQLVELGVDSLNVDDLVGAVEQF